MRISFAVSVRPSSNTSLIIKLDIHIVLQVSLSINNLGTIDDDIKKKKNQEIACISSDKTFTDLISICYIRKPRCHQNVVKALLTLPALWAENFLVRWILQTKN